jgi:hypothetical protein
MKRIITISAIIALISYGAFARDFKTLDGKIYKNAKIKIEKPNGIGILHSTGITFIKFINLPEEVQKEFNFDRSKALKYEEEIKQQKGKRAQELAEKMKIALKKQAEKDKKKQLKAKKQKEKYDKIKKIVCKQGSPVIFTRKVLYTTGGRPISASTKTIGKRSLFPAHGKYMVVKGKVYLAKNNVMPATDYLNNIDQKIQKMSKELQKTKAAIVNRSKIINQNIDKMDAMLGGTNADKTTYYNNSGAYIGRSSTEAGLSLTQMRLIKSMNKENKALDKSIKKDKSRVNKLTGQIEAGKKHQAGLKKAITNFNTSQKKYIEKHNSPEQQEEVKTASKTASKSASKSEEKLKKLKDMLAKGLISKEVYDKKSSEIVDKMME